MAPLPRVWQWLRARDPDGYHLRRSVRAAVVVPVAFFVGSHGVGNAQFATFAALGSFALLMFANFPGGRAARFGAYLALGVAGLLLIVAGTLLASPSWLAVLAMLVIGFAVLFVGVVSSVINGGVQAALLAFILAVLLPGVRSDVLPRVGGWTMACLVSVPVALFVWPPADQDELRAKSAALCRTLARMLHLAQPQVSAAGDLVDHDGRPVGAPLVEMRRAARELRSTFRTSASRTAAVSTGARAGIRLVEQLDWLSAAVTNACADAPGGWPEQGRRLRDAAARVLSACAAVLDHDATPSPLACSQLADCVAALEAARAAVAAEALDQLRAAARAPDDADGTSVAGEFTRPLYAAHELGYAVSLVAGTVSTIAAADSRSWWARLLGRRAGIDAPSAVTAAQAVASGHFDRHSVWLQNSVRGATGLALAVLLARVVSAQNAFWIGLGALSVLRSSALSTGSTVVRALIGTLVGFLLGGALVAVIGTNTTVLWALLPVVILIAASGPVTASFVAGQAAFTVFTIILFNIIAPAGWRIGVVRIEDVALGCAASLVAGFLLWPRGAAAALGDALAEAYRGAAAYFDAAVRSVANGSDGSSKDAAWASATRLDDALRQYLADQGAKHVPLEDVAALANGAARLRLAGMAVAQLGSGADDVPFTARVVGGSGPDPVAAGGLLADASVVVPAPCVREPTTPGQPDGLAEPTAVLTRRADHVTGWYGELADVFSAPHGTLAEVPPPDARSDESFLDVVLPAVDGCGSPERAVRAEKLLWSGQYLGDVDQLRAHLVEPARKVTAARARSRWQR